jgi:phosphate transport system substrate-binding protein
MKRATVFAAFLSFFLLLSGIAPVQGQQVQVLTVYGSTTCISSFLEPGTAELEKATGIRMRTVGVGTGQGLFALLQGLTEVSAASEDLQATIESAKKYATAKKGAIGIPGNLQYHKIADDEVVAIVNKDNPVQTLTWQQLKGINAGTIKSWKEIGGPDWPIKVVTSHEGSATRLFFQKLVMESAPYAPDAVTVWTTEKEIAEVSEDRAAIGAVSVTFHANGPLNTKAVSTSRIVRPLGLITRGDPSPKVRKVIEFFRTGQGRKFVQSGAGK